MPSLFFATQTNTGLYKFSTAGLGVAVSGVSVATFEATGLRTPQQIGSTVTTGTAPFIVASTTKVDNLHVARATLADSATTNANLTGPITSVGNATAVASQTGTGSTFVMNTSPTLVTPVLGVATATSINKLAITTPATGSTLSIADAKTFTVSNTVTLASTDGATLAIGGGGTLASMAYQSATAVNIDGGTIDGTVIGGTTPAAGSFTTLSATGALTTNGLKEDAAGNLGLGVTPSAHLPAGYGGPILQVGGRASIMGSATTAAYSNNTYYSEGFFRHIGDAPATMQEQINGQFNFYTAPSGTAGNPITFTQAMTLDASGNLLVGATSGSSHTVLKDVTVDAGNAVLLVGTPGGAGTFYGTSGTGQNGANATMRFGKDAVTNRTLNAAGTINASGADYAEYERNNGLTFAKGDIVGFKADGTLTNIFAEAIRFGLKSTNPSYVGGDTWGSEDQVGTRPEQPIRKLDKTEQKVISDGSDEIVDEEGNVVSEAVDAITETVVIALGDTDAEWEAVEAKYQADLTEFNERLEAARQQVDRVAYSGKVPVNVFGAVPGGYIIAAANDASITGQFVQDPDFAQYKRAVGRVNRILEDGRCEVAVMVH